LRNRTPAIKLDYKSITRKGGIFVYKKAPHALLVHRGLS